MARQISEGLIPTDNSKDKGKDKDKDKNKEKEDKSGRECTIFDYVSDGWNSIRETIRDELNVNVGPSVEIVFGHEDFGFYKYSLSVTGSTTDQITWTFEHGTAMPGKGAIFAIGIGPTGGTSWGNDVNGPQDATFTYAGGALGRVGAAVSVTQTSNSSGGSSPAKIGRLEKSFGLGTAIFRGNGKINTGSTQARPIKYSGCGPGGGS